MPCRAARHERKKVNQEVLRARDALAAAEQQMAVALQQIAALQARTLVSEGPAAAGVSGSSGGVGKQWAGWAGMYNYAAQGLQAEAGSSA